MKRSSPSAKALLIQGGHIVDPGLNIDGLGELLIVDGLISWVALEGAKRPPLPTDYEVLNAQGLVVSPGFIDLHCHLREPGYEYKETIASGTRAAARGGFTTVCCMPNTNPPIDTRSTVEFIKNKAEREGVVRVFPIGCITQGGRGEALTEMGELTEAGVVAFSDDGNPVASSQLMRHALEYSKVFNLPLIDHCEDPSLAEGGVMNEGWVATRLGLRGIPAAAEEAMVGRDIALAEFTGARLHLAHISTAGSVDLVRRAKEKGIAVTAEVTPHHLTMTEEWVLGRDSMLLSYDTNAKVNPPLRTQRDIDALLKGLTEGVIDAIATDHAPHATVDKLCEFDAAAFGISGLETALGSLMSLVHQGRLEMATLVSKLTSEPAAIIEKHSGDSPLGNLGEGAPADITLFDPNLEWRVKGEEFASMGGNTPLEGASLKGKVMATLVGGKLVYRDERLPLDKGKLKVGRG